MDNVTIISAGLWAGWMLAMIVIRLFTPVPRLTTLLAAVFTANFCFQLLRELWKNRWKL